MDLKINDADLLKIDPYLNQFSSSLTKFTNHSIILVHASIFNSLINGYLHQNIQNYANVYQYNKDNLNIESIRDIIKRHRTNLQKPTVYLFNINARPNIELQNSILKLLEEPPHNVYFVFLVFDTNDLLPTIRSRSQHHFINNVMEFNELLAELDNAYQTIGYLTDYKNIIEIIDNNPADFIIKFNKLDIDTTVFTYLLIAITRKNEKWERLERIIDLLKNNEFQSMFARIQKMLLLKAIYG